ncbi:MAG: hypothetical protein ACK4PK_05275 [Alphaproteobacteria bacterium]|jgi:hypothetical protein
MIFGLEHVVSAGLMTLASIYSCPQTQPGQVAIQTRNGTPKYYYHIPSAQLGNFQIDTTFSKHDNEIYVVGGVTHGKILISRQVQMLTHSMRGVNAHCVSVGQITVTLDYQPDVYIATEYKPGTCRYQTTMQHEVQHVNLDIITLNEFIPRIQSYIQRAVNSLPPMQPVQQHQVPQMQEWIGMQVEQAAKQALSEMDQVRRARHQRIDSREEYTRLSRACAHEPNPIPVPGQQYRR